MNNENFVSSNQPNEFLLGNENMNNHAINPFMGYMGGKMIPRKDILNCVPKDVNEIVSPFCGGGSFELLAAASGYRVKAHDKFKSLVRLWNVLLKDVYRVACQVEKMFPVHPDILKELNMTGNIHTLENDIEFASFAWCMGRQSRSGLFMNTTFFRSTQSGKSGKKYKPFKTFDAEEWRNWQSPNLSVTLSDWKDTLDNNKNSFLYIDPPYVDTEWYYGAYSENKKLTKQHRKRKRRGQFPPEDHDLLAEKLHEWESGFVLSYIDCPKIRELYHGYDVVFLKYHQGSVGGQQARSPLVNDELLILKPPARHERSVKYLKEDYAKKAEQSENLKDVKKNMTEQLSLFD